MNYLNLDLSDIDGEEWRFVVGSKTHMVSNMGRVKSIDLEIKGSKGGCFIKYGKVLKQGIKFDGYLTASVKIHGKRKTKSAHRLVAMAFINNPENKATVNHKNGVKKDNRIENLEWATFQENMQHAKDTGLIPRGVNASQYGKPNKRGFENVFSKKVSQYGLDGRFIKVWGSAGEVERNFGIKKANLCNGKRNPIKNLSGFLWKYYADGDERKNIPAYVKRDKRIVQISQSKEKIKVWENIMKAAADLNICRSSIQRCLRGQRNNAGGFMWELAD